MQKDDKTNLQFNAEEIDLIESYIKKQEYPEVAGEIQLCVMMRKLRDLFEEGVQYFKIWNYLRNRINSRRNRSENRKNHVAIIIDRASSMFKVFEDRPRGLEPLQKKIKFQNIQYICRGKRKINPTNNSVKKSLEQLVQEMDALANQCHNSIKKKNEKTMSNTGILNEQCLWLFNQLFYSIYDLPYLKQQMQFKILLECLRIDDKILKYSDYCSILSAIGRPKLFNQDFINEEINKLNDVRNHMRSVTSQKLKAQDQLSVGKEVIALHPICGHLHFGSVLAIYKQNQYMVRFLKNQLGTQKIFYTNITLKETNSPQKIITENLNYDVMSLVLKLLQYKSQLIHILKNYNNKAEQNYKKGLALSQSFLEEYGWVGIAIRILNGGLRHILSKFRLRGIDQNNQQQIGKNFSTMLLSPLNLMEKQLQKSDERSDLQASSKIKSIITSFKQTKSEQYFQEILKKYDGKQKENLEMNEGNQQTEKLKEIMLKIIIDLRFQNKNFNINDNIHLNDFKNTFGKSFPTLIYQVNDLLKSISSKLSMETK